MALVYWCISKSFGTYLLMGWSGNRLVNGMLKVTACVELGIAYANGKRCYGFKTDTRTIERELELNPMISGCMIKIFQNYDGDQLIKEIEQYLSENEL